MNSRDTDSDSCMIYLADLLKGKPDKYTQFIMYWLNWYL